MGWRDNLRPASFRGVPFEVDRSAATIGRRTVTHEFPTREEPYVEDLGRRARRFRLDAYVIGEGYMVERDRLLAAFETPGPGRLEHPYWGEMELAVEGEIELVESTAEGGMCRFTVTLVEAGATQVAPVTRADTAAGVTAATDLAEREAKVDFEKGWTLAGAVARVLQSAASLVSNAVSTCRSAVGRVQSVIADLEAVVAAVDALEDVVTERLSLPDQVIGAIVNAYGSICSSIAGIADAIDAALAFEIFAGAATEASASSRLLDALAAADGPLSHATRISLLAETLQTLTTWTDGLPEVSGTTASRQQEAGNQRAFVRGVNVAALVAVSRAAVSQGLEYRDSEQGLAMRDAIAAAVDKIVLDPELPDALYAALVDLQRATHAHFTRIAITLPRVLEHTPQGTQPTLVLAYRLYGDPSREREIVARNPGIRHPGFVLGGQPIKVVARG